MHFAKIEDNVVTQVIVAEADFFDTFVDDNPGSWLQTSYNTSGGQHSNDGTPLRKNFAAIGMTYDSERDAFIAPQPFPSWTLVEETCYWQPPTAYPDPNDDNTYYVWNESTLSWEEST
jgi:hypothetical protein